MPLSKWKPIAVEVLNALQVVLFVGLILLVICMVLTFIFENVWLMLCLIAWATAKVALINLDWKRQGQQRRI